jgi:hypothetical protein
MKLFTALFFMICALTVSAQGVGRNYVDAVGTVQSRMAEKIVVVNSASAALTNGEAVCWDLTADDGVSVDYCAFAGQRAACMVVDTSCAVGARCVCQTKGYFPTAEFVKASGVMATAGRSLYASIDGSIYSIGDAATSQLNGSFPIATSLDSATTGDLEVYLDL